MTHPDRIEGVRLVTDYGSLSVKTTVRDRLEYLRGELRAERISYGELAELQSLVEHIEPGDVELLEAAGVPEFPARFVVVENTPGYLPEDDDPATFEDRESARAYLREAVERYTNEYSENGGYVYREHWSDDGLSCLVTLGEQREFQTERVFEVIEATE